MLNQMRSLCISKGGNNSELISDVRRALLWDAEQLLMSRSMQGKSGNVLLVLKMGEQSRET